jgi:single-strand DNA-binding protein
VSAQVTISGRMTREPELSFGKNGTAIAKFAVVTEKRVKDSAGNWSGEEVSFWDCTAFGAMAENICESLVKGTSVIVIGRMRQEKWVSKEGENRTSWRLVADEVAASCRWRKVTVEEGAGDKPKASYDDSVPFLWNRSILPSSGSS